MTESGTSVRAQDGSVAAHTIEQMTVFLPASPSGRPVPLPPPRELPAAPVRFTGREDRLALLANLFERPSTTGAPSPRVVLWGLPGVGKTWLARQFAHQIESKYPDGQLYVDLQGYANKDRLSASQVLSDWLVSHWRRPRGELSTEEGSLAKEFRSKLADNRMLLVLDNAADEHSIRHLLPGTPSCGVIITSRNKLTGLTEDGFEPVQVEAFNPVESIEVLRALLNLDTDSERLVLERLARPCSGLPLALRIVAGRARAGTSLAQLATKLENADNRLGLVSTFPNGDVDMRELFSWSYQNLDPTAKKTFRLLGLHPAIGSSTDAYAVSVLAGIDLEGAEELLNQLRSQSLLDCHDDRYDTHDLLRAYATELLERPEHTRERREALGRLASAYYGCVNHAFNSLNEKNPMIDQEFLAGWKGYGAGVTAVTEAGGGHKWFASERLNLFSTVRMAAAERLPITAGLACSMFYLLEMAGLLEGWAEMNQIAEKTASTIRDRAYALRNQARLAMVRVLNDQERLRSDGENRDEQKGVCRQAIILLERARALYTTKDSRHDERWARAGRATIVRELADAYRLEAQAAPSESDASQAIENYLEAERVYADLGSENGLASLRQALGQAYVLNKQYPEAESCYRQSLAYAESRNESGELRHPRLKGFSLLKLGDLYQFLERHSAAVDQYKKCTRAFRDLNDPINTARALAKCGKSLDSLRESEAARNSFHEARKIFAERRDKGDADPEIRVIDKWQAALT